MDQFEQQEIVHDRIVAAQQVGKFLLEVVQANLDVDRLVKDYYEILGSHTVRATSRAEGSTLRSISLTHRPRAVDPIYDGNNTQFNPETNEKLFLERDFTEFNEDFKGTAFYEVWQKMPFRVGRMRLNLLLPLTVYSMHRDSAPRAHIALVTNPNCFLTSDDAQTHHIPADGNVHIFDTTMPHTAYNASRQDRIHLTMALADEER